MVQKAESLITQKMDIQISHKKFIFISDNYFDVAFTSDRGDACAAFLSCSSLICV